MTRECPECKHEMEIAFEKYIDAIVWVCPDCGEEIYICFRGC